MSIIEFDVVKCSLCRFLGMKISHFEHHRKRTKRCADAVPLTIKVKGEIPDAAVRAIDYERRSKGVDYDTLMKDRLSVGEYDERITYLFDVDGLIDRLFALSPGLIPSKLFNVTYGCRAPEKFQSILYSRSKYYHVLDSKDDETGSIWIDKKTQLKRFQEGFCVHMIEFLLSICENSVKERRPDLLERAESIRSFYLRKHSCISILDILENGDTYRRARKKVPAELKDMAKFVYDDITNSMRKTEFVLPSSTIANISSRKQ